MKKPTKRTNKRWITIVKPPLTPGQREVFEQLQRCRNFVPNAAHVQSAGGKS